jgi:hypothetical protein
MEPSLNTTSAVELRGLKVAVAKGEIMGAFFFRISLLLRSLGIV